MRQFPKGFIWGASSAAYQIEGGVREDGRGESVWDVFSHTPGKIKNGENGDTAAGSYHRWREDVALLKEMGLGAYRFSAAWLRIAPNGDTDWNQAGLAYYDKLVDALLEAGIQPWMTLYHWDLPQALEAKGGPEPAERTIQWRTAMGWPVAPQAMEWGPRLAWERYGLPIVISENGISCHDAPGPDGQVHDGERIDFLTLYLRALQRAIQAGADVRGYFHWSLTDNFEWAEGYAQRFGLAYVDYATGDRLLKESGTWYAATARRNGVPG